MAANGRFDAMTALSSHLLARESRMLVQHGSRVRPLRIRALHGRLGFARNDRPAPGELDTYRILSNGKGQLHLTDTVEGWLVPGRNPFGLYFYMEDVEVWATQFRGEMVGKRGPEDKPWGMYEFAISDPDQTLVRIGWPTHLRKSTPTAA